MGVKHNRVSSGSRGGEFIVSLVYLYGGTLQLLLPTELLHPSSRPRKCFKAGVCKAYDCDKLHPPGRPKQCSVDCDDYHCGGTPPPLTDA
jgi:hypothetical protein